MNASFTQRIKSFFSDQLLPLAILVVGIGLAAYLGQKEDPPRVPEPGNDVRSLAGRLERVAVQEVAKATELNIDVDGEVVPYRDIRIATEVAGKIVHKAHNCEAGNYVHAGEELFTIDDHDYVVEKDRLEKQLENEAKRIGEIKKEIENLRELIFIAKKDRYARQRELLRLTDLTIKGRSRAALENAEREFYLSEKEVLTIQQSLIDEEESTPQSLIEAIEDRDAKQLKLKQVIDFELSEAEFTLSNKSADSTNIRDGFVSGSEIDKAKQSLYQAENSVVSLQNQLSLLELNLDRQVTARELAETQLNLAKRNVERTMITAPVSGVISRENVEKDSFVQRGEVLIAMEDTSKVEVVANLRMDQLYWILDQRDSRDGEAGQGYMLPQTDAKIKYIMRGREVAYTWDARLERYDGIGLDSGTRMVPVRLIVDSPTCLNREDSTDSWVGPLKANECEPLTEDSSPDFSEDEKMKGPSALVTGMFVKVRLSIQTQTQLLKIPETAIVPGNFIYRFVQDDEALRTTFFGSEDERKNLDLTNVERLENVRWGRIQRCRVNPIAALATPRVGHENCQPGDCTESHQEGDSGASCDRETYWVCEAVDMDVLPGNEIVTSPIADGTIAARVEENEGARSAMETNESPPSTVQNAAEKKAVEG